MPPDKKIPGIYSKLRDEIAQDMSKEILRRSKMSLYKIIQGPDGIPLKVNKDGTISVAIAGADSSGGAVNTNIKSSEIIQPVDIQARYAQTIQTHSGVSIAPSASNPSAWIDTDGFSELAITLLNDAGTNSVIEVYWSSDGVNKQGYENQGTTNAQRKVFSVTTKARYALIQLINQDAAPHSMSAWAYLKA